MRINSGLIKKTAAITIGILILSLLAALAGSTGIAGRPKDVTANQLSSKLLRLHVIANSDSPEDQALKLAVRDKILETLNSEFENIDDINISRQFIKSNLKYMEEIARQKIRETGKEYSVTAIFGKFYFPVKNYGYVTLPAGEYEALRIIIGNGKGANWWCVLFPPLCFVDITRDETKVSLARVLTPEEIASIENNQEVPIEIRFKIIDLWKEAKGKIDKTIKLAFK